jgi:hypothetical protein
MTELKEADKKKILVAVDIEKAGSRNLEHKIIAIGYTVGDVDGNVIDKGSWNFAVKWPEYKVSSNEIINYGDFEKSCWDDFWGNRKKVSAEVIANLQTNTYEYTDGMAAFCKWLNSLEEKYPVETNKIILLSDNPSFDLAAIDVELERHCNRQPMRYSTTGKYRDFYDPTDMLETMPDKYLSEVAYPFVNSHSKHDHKPENDAEEIYFKYIAACAAKKKVEEMFNVYN